MLPELVRGGLIDFNSAVPVEISGSSGVRCLSDVTSLTRYK